MTDAVIFWGVYGVRKLYIITVEKISIINISDNILTSLHVTSNLCFMF